MSVFNLLFCLYTNTSRNGSFTFSSIVSGRWFRKSRSSRMKLGTCSQRGFKTMSMKLLSRWVGDDGPATIGRSLRSGGTCTLMYVEFCWSMASFTACDLCIFGHLRNMTQQRETNCAKEIPDERNTKRRPK